jgi:hypothetical protein
LKKSQSLESSWSTSVCPDNVTADVVTTISPEGWIAMTSLSIVGIDPIDLVGKPKLAAQIDGVLQIDFIDFWHTVEFSRFRRTPSAQPSPASPSGQLSYFSG